MAFAFEIDEGVREAVLRCAAEQLDSAILQLSERVGDDPVKAVHSARTAMKKERSLLRLARGSMDAGQRRRENAILRNAAGQLSRARDAEAMLETFDRLSERYVAQLPESSFAAIRARLVVGRQRARSELADSASLARPLDQLTQVRARVDRWTLSTGGWGALQDGLHRSYSDGRAAYRHARSRRSTAQLHQWRKRAKDLWYQQRLLAPIAGPAIKGQAKEAHRLSDLLGDDHDLVVLRRALRRGTVDAPVDVEAMIDLIDHHRGLLQRRALGVGAGVYAERPGAFVARTRYSWRAGRAQARTESAERPAELAGVGRIPHAG